LRATQEEPGNRRAFFVLAASISSRPRSGRGATKIMLRLYFCGMLLPGLAACGGGSSGGGSTNMPDPPPVMSSPGGIWVGADSAAAPVSLYIAETGKLRATLHPDGGPAVSFGSGSVDVSSGAVVSGSFELQGSLLPAPFPGNEDLGCSLSGSLQERETLTVDAVCSDSGGIVYDEALTLAYESVSYERASSLADIAGNYTLFFQPDTNSLNIAGDGTLFGMYHNGANCTINGRASIIDASYTLIDVSWTMSGCTDLRGIYEGVEMSGFAIANPAPTGDPDSYYFLLTGQTDDGLYAVSVLYEPA